MNISMHILTLNYEYPPLGGGAGPITQAMAERLAAAGHEVDVVTMAFRGLPRIETHGRLRVYRVPALRKSKVRAVTVEMLSYVCSAAVWSLLLAQSRRYDVIHAHFIIPTGVVATLLQHLKGIPTVITIHGSDVPSYNPDRWKRGHRVLKPFWRMIVRRTSALVSPSHYLCGMLQEHCAAPVVVIPHGYDPPPPSAAPRQRRILTASRLFRRKGVQFLLDALAGLEPGVLEGWEIVVAGDGPMLPALQEQAARLGLVVQFPGFVTRDVLQQLYASSELFVFPSLRENFPVVLLEAMSNGCAVVCSNVSGMPEIVGDDGVLVPPEDIEALRAAVRRLLTDAPLRRELGARARTRIDQFAWEQILARYLAVFQQVIEDSR